MLFTYILSFIVAIAYPNIAKGINPTIVTRLTSLVLIYAGAISFNSYYYSYIGSGIGIYNGLFHITNISQLLDTFLLIIASFILIGWPLVKNNKIVNISNNNSSKIEKINYGSEYSLIIVFSTLGSILLISSSDLISMYLSIELQSFGVYILASLYRYSESASYAGLKYFLLGGLSSCIILFGSAIIYTYTGLTNFESIYSLLSVYENINLTEGSLELASKANNGFTLGLILVIIGFLFKIAAAPLHNWAPDVYNDTPTIVTIWLTIIPKIAILMFLLDLITQSTPSIGYGLNISSYSDLSSMTNNFNLKETVKNLLLISSLLSLIVGSVVGLAQTKIKRLLAYSTISHIGFILLALAINTEQSIESFIFYIIQYSITNLNTFLIILALGYIINNTLLFNNSNKDENSINNSNKEVYAEKDIVFISEFKGQFFSNPILSLSLSICLFSMAGVPPLIGFFSKQFVLLSAVENGYYFMSIVAIIVSVISASYYIKIVRVLHSENISDKDSEHQRLNEVEVENSIVISNFHSFTISALTLSILLFILKPSIILNSVQLLSLSIFNQ